MASDTTPLLRSSQSALSAEVGESPGDRDEILAVVTHLEEDLARLRDFVTWNYHEHEVEKDKKKTNRKRRRRWLTKKFTERLLGVTLLCQVLNVTILTLLDLKLTPEQLEKHAWDEPAFTAGVLIMVVIQLVLSVLVVASSVKLTKQMLHRTASSAFLIQSYLSTILLYAGIYTLLNRLDKTAFADLHVQGDTIKSSTHIILTFVKLFYFSVSTMTGTGYGDVHALAWYMDLFVSSQMLLSMVYTVTIFARGITMLGGQNQGNAPNATATASILPRSRTTSPRYSLDDNRPRRHTTGPATDPHVAMASFDRAAADERIQVL